MFESNSVNVACGKVVCGEHVQWGKNVTVNVSEELVIGDRCVIPDDAHFEGRRITIGSDFFGYSWQWKCLDIGRGRFDDEDAVLMVGDRVTMHENRIDLSKSVTIGNDVGLSPECCIYTHHYWNNPLEGFPMRHAAVKIGDGVIVGFRSVILAETEVHKNTVVGAQSVVTGTVGSQFLPQVWGGNPARLIKNLHPLLEREQRRLFGRLMHEFADSRRWRGLQVADNFDFPVVRINGCELNLLERTCTGEEDEHSDDLRDWLFKHGVRIYSRRSFKKMRSQR